MTRPSLRDVFAETAELAFETHWGLDTILDLEHGDRRRFLEELAELRSSRHEGA
jgi:hypothetical protein